MTYKGPNLATRLGLLCMLILVRQGDLENLFALIEYFQPGHFTPFSIRTLMGVLSEVA